MFCSHCGNKIDNNVNFCQNCGSPRGLQNSNTINGDGNLNFGQNNTILADKIFINNQNTKDETAYISREKVIPLKIMSVPITNKMTIFLGTIGFIGSIASIWSTWLKDLNLFYLFVYLIPFAGLGILLTKQRFARLFFSWNIEANKKGELFFTKVKGQCPKCDGILKLKEIGEENNKVSVVQCSRNKAHLWKFDFTIFDDIKT